VLFPSVDRQLGIGNTTSAAALACLLIDQEGQDCCSEKGHGNVGTHDQAEGAEKLGHASNGKQNGLGARIRRVCGTGTGVNDEALAYKCDVIKEVSDSRGRLNVRSLNGLACAYVCDYGKAI
jgi:NaMN:DMB phosphoribosyltransferase